MRHDRLWTLVAALWVGGLAATGCNGDGTPPAPTASAAASSAGAGRTSSASATTTAPPSAAEPRPVPPGAEGTLACEAFGCKVVGSLSDALLKEVRARGALDRQGFELRNFADADVARLTGLKDVLKELTLREADATVMAPLGELGALGRLTLWDLKKASDFSALGKLTGLKRLSFHGTGFASSAFFASLTALEELQVFMPPDSLTEVAGLAGLPKLRKLELYAVRKLTDIAPLKGLPALEDLSLYSSDGIADLSPLSSLTTLKRLDLYGADAKDLAPVAALKNLEWIWIYATQFQDYGPLAALENLKELAAGISKFDKLDVIAKMPGLTSLRLWKDPVKDFSALKGAKNLKTLELRETAFGDLGLLAGLEKLERLDISLCNVSNVQAITALPNLRELKIDGTKGIADVSVFKSLPALTSIDVDENQFPAAQLAALKAAKPALRVL